jgi:hypothetical protein
MSHAARGDTIWRRQGLVGIVALAAAGLAAAQDVPYVAYPQWQPRSRDQAVLLASSGHDMTVAIDPDVCRRLVQLVQERDGNAMADLVEKGQAIFAHHMDPVLILEAHESEHKDVFSWKVRLLTGPAEGKVAYVPTVALGRLRTEAEIARDKAMAAARPDVNPMMPGFLFPAPARKMARPIEKKEPPRSAPPVEPGVLATNLLRSAIQLEDRGATLVAGKLYDKVVKEYPTSPEAAKAKKRLEALKARNSR